MAELLSPAYSEESTDRWLDNMLQELCHQYTVSVAAFGAAPPLVKLVAIPDVPLKDLLYFLVLVIPTQLYPIKLPYWLSWRKSGIRNVKL